MNSGVGKDRRQMLYLILAHPFLSAAAGILGALFLLSIRYIPNNRVGVIEKLFSFKGSLKSGLIAINGEAGFQPNILRGGWHFLFILQYKIHTMPLVTIPQGKIGYVFSRDGIPLPSTQALASNTKAVDFQDVKSFLANGGQKGPQRLILREGTYAINLVQFVVITEDRPYYLVLDPGELDMFNRMAALIMERDGFSPIILKDADDLVGVATVHDGESLPPGEIIAPTVGNDPEHAEIYHNNFQDPDKFLMAGGKRGRQLQVLVEGTYYINRLFATVERIPKTIVEVGNVGVVVSYTGEVGEDLSGKDYNHGEMVKKGYRGVWSEALLPGKYAFNTYAGKIVMVPTTNIILKWISNQTGTHRLDENLSEVSLITKDAFEPTLPLSVVVHIDYRKASLVIQRFGDIKRLVEQTLDPMVAAYFKNIGQSRTLIQLIQERSVIQQQAAVEMKERFAHYNLELEEVLIGTPGSAAGDKQIEVILNQLRSRQIAEEQVETYNRQEKAAVKERELREAESRAKQQSMLTESEIGIAVQSNQGKADLARAEQQAMQIKTLSEAEAQKIRIIAEGEARKIKALADADAERAARVGVAQAMAIEEQVNAYGGPQFQLIQQVMQRFAEAIEQSKVDVVPKIQMGNSEGGGLMESLLGVLLSDKLNHMLSEKVGTTAESGSTQTAAIRQELQSRIEPPEPPTSN
jgi:uncharacterized membrane protein YqiK